MAYVAGPYDAEHLYVRWGGKLPGNETWSCGIRMARTIAGTIPAGHPIGMLAELETAFSAFHVAAGPKIHVSAKLSFVQCNIIKTDGLYKEALTYERAIADVSGSASGSHPNQIALACTLETGFTRGPAHRGRFFAPMPAGTIGIDGLITTSDALAAAHDVKGLVDALNAVDTDYEVAVFSRKNPGPAHRTVTGASVGRVLDTQRSRRRSLIEDHQVGV